MENKQMSHNNTAHLFIAYEFTSSLSYLRNRILPGSLGLYVPVAASNV